MAHMFGNLLLLVLKLCVLHMSALIHSPGTAQREISETCVHARMHMQRETGAHRQADKTHTHTQTENMHTRTRAHTQCLEQQEISIVFPLSGM